jgi:hypothetical protein
MHGSGPSQGDLRPWVSDSLVTSNSFFFFFFFFFFVNAGDFCDFFKFSLFDFFLHTNFFFFFFFFFNLMPGHYCHFLKFRLDHFFLKKKKNLMNGNK